MRRTSGTKVSLLDERVLVGMNGMGISDVLAATSSSCSSASSMRSSDEIGVHSNDTLPLLAGNDEHDDSTGWEGASEADAPFCAPPQAAWRGGSSWGRELRGFDSPLGMIAAPRTLCSHMRDQEGEEDDARDDYFQGSYGELLRMSTNSKIMMRGGVAAAAAAADPVKDVDGDEGKTPLQKEAEDENGVLSHAGTVDGIDLEPLSTHGMGPGSPIIALLGFDQQLRPW
jgi:hypothetical protein